MLAMLAVVLLAVNLSELSADYAEEVGEEQAAVSEEYEDFTNQRAILGWIALGIVMALVGLLIFLEEKGILKDYLLY